MSGFFANRKNGQTSVLVFIYCLVLVQSTCQLGPDMFSRDLHRTEMPLFGCLLPPTRCYVNGLELRPGPTVKFTKKSVVLKDVFSGNISCVFEDGNVTNKVVVNKVGPPPEHDEGVYHTNAKSTLEELHNGVSSLQPDSTLDPHKPANDHPINGWKAAFFVLAVMFLGLLAIVAKYIVFICKSLERASSNRMNKDLEAFIPQPPTE